MSMVVSNFCFPTGQIFGAHLGIWLAVGMSVIRVLVIKNPLSERISLLVQAKYGVRIIIVIVLLMFPFWILDYFKNTVVPANELWTSSSNCSAISDNFSNQIQYILQETHMFGNERTYEINIFLEGLLFEFLPSIILPIATLILVIEMRRAKKSAEQLKQVSNSQSSSDRSTSLVVFMTITFIITTAPRGTLYVADFILPELFNVQLQIVLPSMAIGFLINFNSAIHCFICYFMSAQYRSAVKQMCGKNKQKPSVVTVTSIK